MTRWVLVSCAIGAAFSAAACEGMTSVNLPDNPESLVVESVFVPGEPWHVSVSRSYPILEITEDSLGNPANGISWTVPNAEVVIERDGKTIARPRWREVALYVSDEGLPEVGVSYTLRVSAPGFTSVEATAIALEPAQGLGSILDPGLSLFDLEQEVDLAPEPSTFEIELDPPDEVEAFYLVRILATRHFLGPSAQLETTFKLRNLPGELEQVESRDLEEFLFRSGVTDRLEVDVRTINGARYSAEVFRVPQSYFHYKRSVERQLTTGEIPYSEPSPVFSNVSHGLGFFAGASRTEIPIGEPHPVDVIVRGHQFCAIHLRGNEIGESGENYLQNGSLHIRFDENGGLSGDWVQPDNISTLRASERSASFGGTWMMSAGELTMTTSPDLFFSGRPLRAIYGRAGEGARVELRSRWVNEAGDRHYVVILDRSTDCQV